MIATVREVIAKERLAGATDDQIALLLGGSGLAPLRGHHHWQRVAVREAMGEEASHEAR